MCGILAYFRPDGISNSEFQDCLKALHAMQHRGPDGEGVVLIDTRSEATWIVRTPETPAEIETTLEAGEYKDRSATLFLGHRRLSIFDLSAKGHQPMRDRAGNWLIFNGEVYNFFELKKDLEARGQQFESGTDTEVIMTAFREQGPECLRSFNGMWTMILYSAKEKKLLVTNDRFHIKPLFYFQDQALILASQIKALRQLRPGLQPNRERIGYYLATGNTDFDDVTLLEGVYRFPPAHFTWSKPEAFSEDQFRPYWRFPAGQEMKLSTGEAAERFRTLFSSAINLRMRSDVEWGTTLSGGLDSSGIVYTAQKLLRERGEDRRINTFSAVFPGREGDESEFVKIIADDLGLNAAYVNPMEEFSLDDFRHFLSFQDLPVKTTSMYAQWCVMRLVGNSEVKVLLDGQGGDELFGGYHHHFYRYLRELVLRFRFGKYFGEVSAYSKLKNRSAKGLHRLVVQDLRSYASLRLRGNKGAYSFNKPWLESRKLNEMLRVDIQSWILRRLLRFEDRNSMAFSLEARVPFLDHRLVEFALMLPAQEKIRQGWQKAVMREALDYMPESIRYRKDKKGFTTPHKAWVEQFRNEFAAEALKVHQAGLAHSDDGSDPSTYDVNRLFRYANLGLWLEAH